MAEVIADDLADRGYEALATGSGRDALERLRRERIDALVTDIGMPEVNGLTLLRASIELDPSRPVIVITAYNTLETAVRATGDGAYHYLPKPFRLDLLFRLLQQALALR
jgi:two-component system response regulator HydG